MKILRGVNSHQSQPVPPQSTLSQSSSAICISYLCTHMSRIVYHHCSSVVLVTDHLPCTTYIVAVSIQLGHLVPSVLDFVSPYECILLLLRIIIHLAYNLVFYPVLSIHPSHQHTYKSVFQSCIFHCNIVHSIYKLCIMFTLYTVYPLCIRILIYCIQTLCIHSVYYSIPILYSYYVPCTYFNIAFPPRVILSPPCIQTL